MIALDYPPSANVMWRRGKHGGMYLTEAAQQYKDKVGWTMKEAGIQPIAGNVVVTLHIYRPQRKGDVDNRIKVLLDAMQGFGYNNDEQVVELHAHRHDDKKNPRVEVELTERQPAFTYKVAAYENREIVIDLVPCELAQQVQKALADIQGVDHVVNCHQWLAVVPKLRVKMNKLKSRLEDELARLVVEG